MNDLIPHRIKVMAGIVGLILIAASVTVALQIGTGALAGGYTLHAVFDRAGQGLYTGNDVKERGVTVGSVQSVHLLATGRVDVHLHMSDGVKVPDTASASIEPLSVFGPKYVNLTPGDHELSGPFLAHGAAITQTTPATDLLDVLDRTYRLFGKIDPNDLATIVQTVSTALDGLGPDIGQTIDSLRTIASAARAQIPDLHALVVQLDQLTTALAPHAPQVQVIATNLNQVLPEIASHPDQVAALLDDVSDVAGDLSGLLEAHRPAVDAVVDGLGGVTSTLYAGRADLPPLVGSLADFFNLLSRIIRTPGEPLPGGRLAGNIEGNVSLDPCILFVGVC